MKKILIAAIYEHKRGKRYITLGITKDRMVAIVQENYKEIDTVLFIEEHKIVNKKTINMYLLQLFLIEKCLNYS